MPTFEIYTYGGGEYLRLIFNGIAAIMSNVDYFDALKIATLLGILAIVMRVMFTARVQEFSTFLAILVVLYIAFVPRANVMIIDRIDPGMGSVVANVPMGVAATAGLASRFGDWATRAFETVFSLPDDLDYSNNGTLFGTRLVQASTRFTITDRRIAANLSEFWANCVYYDIVLGLYDWDDLAKATDLWAFLKNRTSRVRRFTYTYDGGRTTLAVCRDAINGGPLDQDVSNEVSRVQRYYAQRIFSGLSVSDAVARFSAAMPVAYQYLTNLSASTSDLLRQTILANSARNGLINFSTRSDATAAAVDYATARAESERRTTYQAVGEMALRTLPLLRNIFEALIYAIFPVVLLLAMIAPKPAIVGYLKSIFWVQLWAPLYAVLHLGVMLYAKGQASSAVLLPAGAAGLTLDNITDLGQNLADMGYIAGYLSMSIPLIAYMVVQSGGAMMGSLAATFSSSMQMAAARGAEEATTGNISMGNTSFDNVSWFKNNRAPVSNVFGGTMTGPDGTVTTYTAGGDAFHAYPQHTGLPMDADAKQAINSHIQTQTGESVRALQSTVAAYSNSLAAEYSSMSSYLSQAARNSGVTQDWTNAEQGSFAREAGEVRQITQNFAKEHNLSESQAAQLLAAAGLSVEQPGLFKLVNPVNLRGQLGLEGVSQDKFQEAWKDAQQTAIQTRYGEQMREAREAAHREGLTEQIQAQHARSDTEQGGFSDRQVSLEEVRASLERAKHWQRVQSYVEEHGLSVSGNLMPMALRALPGRPKADGGTWTERDVQEHIVAANAGDERAATTLYAAIGDLVTDPDFVRRLGIPLAPSDAGAVYKHWRTSQAEVDERSDVAERIDANKAWIHSFGETNPSGENLEPGAVRADIRARGNEIRAGNEATRQQASGDLDKTREDIDRQVETSEEAVREKTDHPGVLGRAVSLDPMDYGAGKIRDWLKGKGDESDNEDERPARSVNRRRGRH